jgi:hypothetical protein
MARQRIQPKDRVFSYLVELGYSEHQIDAMGFDTKLYHDLGIYGDSAREDMQRLSDKFGVDLADFDFARYFPPEFEGGNRLEIILISYVPFASRFMRRRKSYLPLTLGMIEQSILAKKWQSSVSQS